MEIKEKEHVTLCDKYINEAYESVKEMLKLDVMADNTDNKQLYDVLLRLSCARYETYCLKTNFE